MPESITTRSVLFCTDLPTIILEVLSIIFSNISFIDPLENFI
tara:strand:+ start:226 stop:351 length:126 start_codon:yes stop_codon:yes gene_type:complete